MKAYSPSQILKRSLLLRFYVLSLPSCFSTILSPLTSFYSFSQDLGFESYIPDVEEVLKDHKEIQKVSPHSLFLLCVLCPPSLIPDTVLLLSLPLLISPLVFHRVARRNRQD